MAFSVTARSFAPAGELPPHLAGREAFRAAQRHSGRVRFLRKAIPLACVGLAVFLVLRGIVGLFIGGPAEVAGSFRIEGRKIVMDKPRLSGFKKDGSSYEMTAESAVQDLKQPNVVDLQRLTARMQAGAEGWANLSGDTGTYDSKAERLFVRGNVRVKTESGTDATLEDADIDFKSGTVVTEKPTNVKTAQGNVTSDRMEVRDGGKRLIFEGRVSSEFVNNGVPGAPAPAR